MRLSLVVHVIGLVVVYSVDVSGSPRGGGGLRRVSRRDWLWNRNARHIWHGLPLEDGLKQIRSFLVTGLIVFESSDLSFR